MALPFEGDVDKHDAVLLTMPIRRIMPIIPITSSGRPTSMRVRECAETGRRERRQNCQWVLGRRPCRDAMRLPMIARLLVVFRRAARSKCSAGRH